MNRKHPFNVIAILVLTQCFEPVQAINVMDAGNKETNENIKPGISFVEMNRQNQQNDYHQQINHQQINHQQNDYIPQKMNSNKHFQEKINFQESIRAETQMFLIKVAEVDSNEQFMQVMKEYLQAIDKKVTTPAKNQNEVS